MVALLTIKKNCDEEVRARIGGFREAKEAYEELKKAYEGKSVTELGALMKSVTRMYFDDRKTSIQDHITEYRRAWNSFVAITARLDLTNDGTGLQHIAKDELAKVEFLLDSLPPFYSNTVENIKSKDINYDDVIRKLIQYIPQRQKGRPTDGGKDDPVVLKVDKKVDTSKQCTYCQKTKGWKGIGHTKEECRSYKKEKKEKAKAKKAKAEKEESSDSENDGVSVCMIRIGKTEARKEGWFQYDTGTSHHTTNDLTLLKNVKDVSLPVEAHDGTIRTCHKQGTLEFTHQGKTIRYPDCLYDPSFSNLVSGQRLGDHDIKARGKTATIKMGNRVVYTAERDKQGGMWIKIGNVSSKDTIMDLHQRYGHISFNTILSLPECPKPPTNWKKPRCIACEAGKTTKPPSPKQDKTIRTTKPLERIHADLIGPIKPVTPGNQYQYLLVVVDDFTRYVSVKPLRNKSNAAKALVDIMNKLENSTNLRTRQVQADWGGEFQSKELAIELEQRGTTMKETVPYHSETNAIVERMNRTILDMNRTAIAASGMPKGMWGRVSQHSAYTKNRIPHKSLNGKCPHEILYPSKDIVQERTNLRPFGQKVNCYDYETNDKLSPRNYEGRIVGYTSSHGTYCKNYRL